MVDRRVVGSNPSYCYIAKYDFLVFQEITDNILIQPSMEKLLL